ncbi:hypothetical protein [Psychromicrobium xiongbiense]|uniref:hypothetical protein n=1 Tax=Psychromicrobium xiongbiense TaxID=3051184 RepID=UPI002554F82C|nr:hypothetical protein [Psychromicrobium sp. YIM S02556]
MMACVVIKSVNPEALSALPNAPVIAPAPARHARGRTLRLQAGLASLLHRLAWAIEPRPATRQECSSAQM